MMLPLDTLSPQARYALEKRGVKEEDLSLVVGLDLDQNGDYGEGWLAVDSRRGLLLYLSSPKRISKINDSTGPGVHAHHRHKEAPPPTEQELERDAACFNIYAEHDLERTYGFYVDNFVSSNRILALQGEPYLEDPDVPQEERERQFRAHRLRSDTIVIGYCTNARKKKLFAFLDILRRLQRKEEISESDPIFEQFQLRCPKCGKVYADQNRRICEDCVKSGAIFKRLMHYLKPFRLELVTVLGCMFFSSLVSLLSPILNGQLLLDQVISPPNADGTLGRLHQEHWVWITVGVILLMALLQLGVSIIQHHANAKLAHRVTFNMKMDVFTAMQRLSLSFFNNSQTGRLITRVNYDADRIRNFYVDGVPNFIFNSLNFIGLTIFLFSLNWKLTLIVFVPVPIIVCIFKFALPKLWRMYSKLWRRSSSLNSLLGDTLNGIRVVKAFAKETEEANRFHAYSERQYKADLQVNLTSLTIFPVISLLIGLSSQAIWGFGGFEVMGGHMTYGEFTTYFGYLVMIFGPLNFFTNFMNLVTDTINAAQRMFEVLDAVPEITDAPDAVHFDRLKGDITFRKVCFHYAPNRPILKNMSFEIHAGDQVGLVGHTGAGKSTIANLINRLYDVISGSIEIDGVNVKQIASETLRRNIAIVSQEIFLFKGTIADNIRYAKPDASMEEVIRAAKAANAHDFIMRLPDGYETVVGTGARSLSGGERQRVSIARALLLDPSILILDEATAAMDTETERLIQDALGLLCAGRTTITIAHRLSTLKDCNYLMAIEDGEIAEQGTHDQLIDKKGIYYRLYTLQTESMKRVLQGM